MSGLRIGAAVVVASFVLAAPAAGAHQPTGGYPYWNFDGPGSNPATYTWTDASGYGFSPYGYAFRNCTDYVAWKLSTANHFRDYRGLGNAVSWAAAARARGYRVNHVPGLGSVAWWGAEKFHGFGHVAWVLSVGIGTVVLDEYNHEGNGRFDTRRIQTGMADAYIHFRDLPAEIPRQRVPPRAGASPARGGAARFGTHRGPDRLDDPSRRLGG